MLLEDLTEVVDAYFLTMNIERGDYDTFEIIDIEEGKKELKIKSKKSNVDNDKIDGMMYLMNEAIHLKIFSSLALASEIDRAKFICSRNRKIMNQYLFEFRVRTQEEIVKVLMLFDNYFKEMLKENR